MGERTGIAWCDSTRNFWAGCTKVGPGCDGCYAEAFNRWTRGKSEETGEAKNWGPGAPRVPYIKGAMADCLKWNARAKQAGKSRTVFINTFSDTFDNEAPDDWRASLWLTILACHWIDFLLVTKRVGNVAKMAPPEWLRDGFPSNVRILITVVNQEEADRDVPKLLMLPCRNGISYEPALGPIDWRPWRLSRPHPPAFKRCIEWVIVGGESKQPGHAPRPFNIWWAREAIAQCQDAGVPVFIKQLGSLAYDRQVDDDGGGCLSVHNPERLELKHEAGEDPSEWPEDLRVREYPPVLVPA